MVYETFDDLVGGGGIASIEAGHPDDLYVVSASYEPRCISLTGALAPDYRSGSAIIYVNEDHLTGQASSQMQTALDILQVSLRSKVEETRVVRGSWADAAAQVSALRSAIQELRREERPHRITVDVTTFNREALIVCLALLRATFHQATLRILYVSPKSHGAWLSRGFRRVRSIVGFSGVQQASRPTVLVVLSGFEGDRTIKIIEEYEPSRVFLGFGDPPTVKTFLDRNIDEHKLILGRTDVEEFRFPAAGIVECSALLSATIEPLLSTCNVVIAPMSTKLSTVAAFLVAERHREIQLAYCLPGEYNYSEYSEGMDRAFVEVLDFNEPSA